MASQPRRTTEPRQAATLRAVNVAAGFRGTDRAREALDRLQRHGIDGSRLSVVGLEATDDKPLEDTDVVRSLTRAEALTAARDERFFGFFSRRVLLGAAIGAALGAIAAVLIVGFADLLDPTGAALAIGALFGAVAGGAVGALVAGVAAAPYAPAWEETLADVRGVVVVAVHLDDRERARSSLEELRSMDPVATWTIDANGVLAPTDAVIEETLRRATEGGTSPDRGTTS